MSKNLAVFDFDHTIIDDNSDTVVRDLINPNEIPNRVKEQYTSDGWTAYMQAIFRLLQERNIGEETIKGTIGNIRPSNGMDSLIIGLKDIYNCDTIIISDSNSYFINSWLEKYSLKSYVDEVFTNPAYFDDKGLLNIGMYHLQTDCQLSTKNLCKGRIMEEYLAKQEQKGIKYNKIVYLGDGYNDLCPILRLKDGHLACVRENYKCAGVVRKIQQGRPINASNQVYSLKCDVFYWKNGHEILDVLKNYL